MTFANAQFGFLMKLLSKGLTLEDISESEDLEQLDLLHPTVYLSNPEERMTSALTTIVEGNEHHRLALVDGGSDLFEFLTGNPGWTLETLPTVHQDTVLVMLETKVEATKKRLTVKEALATLKLTNRSEYLPVIDVIYDLMRNGQSMNVHFEKGLAATGILARMLEALGQHPQGIPLVLRIVNNLPYKKNKKGELTNEQHPIPVREWELLRKHGWLPTQGNLAFNWAVPHLKNVLMATFPAAIDLGAYGHRLSSPLIPGGFMENVSVRFSNPTGWVPGVTEEQKLQLCKEAIVGAGKTTKQKLQLVKLVDNITIEQLELIRERMFPEVNFEEVTKDLGTMVDMECDGSGLYDPAHPLMAELIARYGVVPFQWTVLRPDGLFCKGIIVPRENLCTDTGWAEAIHADMAQVKGSWKEKFKEGDVAEGCFVGIMKSWSKESYFPGCFELLEFIAPSKSNGKTYGEIDELLTSLVEEAVEEIAEDGIEGLMKEIARDDDNLRLVTKFVTQLNANGLSVNPMSIPMLKSALDDKLRAKLWVLQQGAGISGKQYVTVLDATVPEGHVVCRGFKVGTELAIWRFPAVLAQGLVIAVVDEGRPHHKHEGKVVANTVWMNPRDLTARMQGDDDGDIVGISNDERVRALFKARMSKDVFEIEPKKGKYAFGSDDPEGHTYLETDPRGPVGMTTIWQAQLLAVGDNWGSLAMAVLNQEAIDSAKGAMKWTDVRKACNAGSWEKRPSGNWALKDSAKLALEEYEADSSQPVGWPGKMTGKWVLERINKAGCAQNEEIWQNPLSWRVQGEMVNGVWKKLSKRVSPSYWEETKRKDKGWGGGNTVHRCADIARATWMKRTGEWKHMGILEDGAPELTLDVRDLLAKLMVANNCGAALQASTWEEYMELRGRVIPLKDSEGNTVYNEDGVAICIGLNLNQYGAAFKLMLTNVAGKEDSDEKFVQIEFLTQSSNAWFATLSTADLATIYYWELTPTWKITKPHVYYTHEQPQGAKYTANKPNMAFRAICWPGSPLLPMLGINDAIGCNYLSKNNRSATLTKWAMRQKGVEFKKLNTWFYTDKTHGNEKHDEEGNRIETFQCKHCMDSANTGLVRAWRNTKTKGEIAYMIELIRELKAAFHRPWHEATANMGADELGNCSDDTEFGEMQQ